MSNYHWSYFSNTSFSFQSIYDGCSNLLQKVKDIMEVKIVSLEKASQRTYLWGMITGWSYRYDDWC